MSKSANERDTIKVAVLGGLAVYLLLALAVVAFGLWRMRTEAEKIQASAREIRVVASEFAFEPEEIVVERGETVRFVVENVGVVPHEFRLTTQPGIDEHLEERHAGEEHDEEEPGVIVIDAGETGELLWTFDEGDAAAIERAACLLPGHYEAGMVGNVKVQDGEGPVSRKR